MTQLFSQKGALFRKNPLKARMFQDKGERPKSEKDVPSQAQLTQKEFDNSNLSKKTMEKSPVRKTCSVHSETFTLKEKSTSSNQSASKSKAVPSPDKNSKSSASNIVSSHGFHTNSEFSQTTPTPSSVPPPLPTKVQESVEVRNWVFFHRFYC